MSFDKYIHLRSHHPYQDVDQLHRSKWFPYVSLQSVPTHSQPKAFQAAFCHCRLACKGLVKYSLFYKQSQMDLSSRKNFSYNKKSLWKLNHECKDEYQTPYCLSQHQILAITEKCHFMNKRQKCKYPKVFAFGKNVNILTFLLLSYL